MARLKITTNLYGVSVSVNGSTRTNFTVNLLPPSKRSNPDAIYAAALAFYEAKGVNGPRTRAEQITRKIMKRQFHTEES